MVVLLLALEVDPLLKKWTRMLLTVNFVYNYYLFICQFKKII